MSENKSPVITAIKNVTYVLAIGTLFICSIPIYVYDTATYYCINKFTTDVKSEHELLVNNLDKNIEEYNGKTEEEYYKHIREENARSDLYKKINPQNYPGILSLVKHGEQEYFAQLSNWKNLKRRLDKKINPQNSTGILSLVKHGEQEYFAQIPNWKTERYYITA